MDKKKFRKYTNENMAEALAAAKADIPIATASKRFGVPRITLRNKLKGISPEICNMGPPTILSTEEKGRIVTWIIDIARAGFPVTKQCLTDTVAKLIKELGRKNPFSDGIPGKKWFKSFLMRHPNISLKTPEKLTGYRGKLTEGDIRNWFKEVSSYLKENDYYHILENGDRIFNADETSISLCPKTGKVLAPKGIKNIYDVSKTSEKENLTVLITVAASGNMAPPMVVYPYKRTPSEIAKNFPKGWGLGKSESGWMTGEVFFEYMANIFEPWLTENNIERPVFFFVDRHKSHLTLHLNMFLREKEIILVAFFPNATHVMQPLDVAVFYPLKSKWKIHVRKWLTENENQQLMRHHVAKLLETILKDAMSPDTIKNGFRVCGLYPFDANNVDYSKILHKQHTKEADDSNKQDNVMNDDIKNCLKVLEANISANVLQIMKEHLLEDEWSGPESTKDLFNTWKRIQKLNSASVSEKNGNIIDINISLNFSLEIDDNTLKNTQNEEHVPQEVTKPSEKICQEVTEDLHVTAESDKNHITPEEYQVHAAIAFVKKNQQTPDNSKPSTSKTIDPSISNAYFQPHCQEIIVNGTQHTPFKNIFFSPRKNKCLRKK